MLTNKIALKGVEAAEAMAKKLGISITTTVVDEHGAVLLVSRMKGAFVISPEFSYQKAFTSSTLGLPTEEISKYSIPGKPYYGILNVVPGKISIIAGGIPVVKDGKTLGGVGVGGSSDVSQDVVCAKECVKAILKALS